VLAVDPSSPFSGGALLGDRVRMVAHATDPGVFIRSMASRGQLGGLSAATPGAVDLLSAVGFDLVLVETVGVGQNEVDVMRLADTVVVVVAPGMGDGVQAAKAGILEIADLLVVNKADREGAATTVRELRAMVAVGRAGAAGPADWRMPMLSLVAVDGTGLDEVTAALAEHREHLVAGGELHRRRRERAAAGVRAGVFDRVDRALGSPAGRQHLAAAAAEITAGSSDQYHAADEVLHWLVAARGNPEDAPAVGPA
jgi:LAO/AO transport system kinase